MDHNNIEQCIEEWESLSEEYKALENLHNEYRKKLDEMTQMQQKCLKQISHQRYRLGIIKNSLKRFDHSDGSDDRVRNELLQKDLTRRKAQLYEMENILPKPNGLYLKIILGNINTSILDKNDRFRYKDEYEKFKLVMSLIALGLSVFNLFTNFRTADLIHMFLLVWYYCTLTIRESILKVNGSRIKGWWRAHHFISTVLAGVILIWPNGQTYYAFRQQFMAFGTYIGFVQYLQFMYQRGSLYRLKALGQRPNMDITIEGFNSWMWRGLGFLFPFLFIGYFFELYNAYTLYVLSYSDDAEWHVTALACLFTIVFLGNMITTIMVIPQKLKERIKLRYRFTRLDKYFWTHKKRRVSFRNPETPSKLNCSTSKSIETISEHSSDTQTTPSDSGNSPHKIQQLQSSPKEPSISEVPKKLSHLDTVGSIEEDLRDISKDIDFAEIDKMNDSTSTSSDEESDDLDNEKVFGSYDKDNVENVKNVDNVNEDTKKDQ